MQEQTQFAELLIKANDIYTEKKKEDMDTIIADCISEAISLSPHDLGDWAHPLWACLTHSNHDLCLEWANNILKKY
jgi:hypothetical protein